MKITHTLYSFFLVMLSFYSCSSSNNDKKDNTAVNAVVDSIKLEWTAYKTTDKIPVKGEFKSVQVTNAGAGHTMETILDQAAFAIDVASLWTGDTSRDEKIKTGFFGTMLDPGKISGVFLKEMESWYMAIKMNGVTVEKIPVAVDYDNKKMSISAHIMLADFKVKTMLDSFNRLCYDLHKGADGVSKTWDEVDVLATVIFQ